jgi:Domain of unknown function (DUF4281)
MSAESFFLMMNIIAGIGWVALIILTPFWKFTDKFVIGIVITLLAIFYSYFNFSHIAEAGGPASFMTFDGVKKVLSNEWLINAAWAHIMAFDLLAGIWIKNNAAKNGISFWIVIPVLLVTIVLTPFGFLIYQLIRLIKTKQYFASIE